MIIFPVNICQKIGYTFKTNLGNDFNTFDSNSRIRTTSQNFPTAQVEITLDSTDAVEFEQFFYNTLNGGVESFSPSLLKIGSLDLEEVKIINGLSSLIEVEGIYTYKFTIQATKFSYSSLQICPSVPELVLFPSDSLVPCNNYGELQPILFPEETLFPSNSLLP